jgi:cobalamin biosynthesis protein CobT
MSEKDFIKVIGGKKGDYGKLSSDEKAAALERYRTLRDHVEKLSEIDDETGEDKLVDIWDKEILDKATEHVRDDSGDIKDLSGFDRKNATNSYIVRAAMDLKT